MQLNKPSNKLKRSLLLLLLLTCAIYICGRVSDPDLWLYLTIGRWIIGHGEIPTIDHWTRFSYGTESLAYSWVFDLIVGWIDLNLGELGLWLAQFLLAIVLVFSLSIIYSKIAKNKSLGAVLACLTAIALRNHFALRPQSIIWIIFIWIIYLLEKFLHQKIKSRYSYISPLTVLLLLTLWANLHITTIIGVAVVFVWSIALVGATKAFIYTSLGILATVITPTLGREWHTFLSKIDHPIRFNLIAEYQTALHIHFANIVFFILVLILIRFVYRNPKYLHPIIHLFWIILLTVGLMVVKFLPFAILLVSFIIAKFLAIDSKQLSFEIRNKKNIVLFGFVLLLILTANLNFILRSPINRANFPIKEFDLLIQKNLPLPFLTNFDIGGYAIYRMSDSLGEIKNPKARVAIDGRTNLITSTTWDIYEKALNGLPGWEELIQYAEPNTIIWNVNSPLVELLIQSGNWCRVQHEQYNIGGQFTVLTKAAWVKMQKEKDNHDEWKDILCLNP